eukprot:TRINITY_DN9051_c0_g1_i1.p1 TRINITY_DN9051_c0_g1~~TRINITY_DN9051_c0_g1_i1.p1  ORF type:complete len:306 (-),score=94.90 TRINITY_DN9051_c0_g1_i1:170-1087(-)
MEAKSVERKALYSEVVQNYTPESCLFLNASSESTTTTPSSSSTMYSSSSFMAVSSSSMQASTEETTSSSSSTSTSLLSFSSSALSSVSSCSTSASTSCSSLSVSSSSSLSSSSSSSSSSTSDRNLAQINVIKKCTDREQQNQMIGEIIYEELMPLYGQTNTGKITGMLLEMELSDLFQLLENKETMRSKGREAFAVLYRCLLQNKSGSSALTQAEIRATLGARLAAFHPQLHGESSEYLINRILEILSNINDVKGLARASVVEFQVWVSTALEFLSFIYPTKKEWTEAVTKQTTTADEQIKLNEV